METFKFEAGGGGGGGDILEQKHVFPPGCRIAVPGQWKTDCTGLILEHIFEKGAGLSAFQLFQKKKNVVEQWNIDSRSFIQLWNLNGTKIDFGGFMLKAQWNLKRLEQAEILEMPITAFFIFFWGMSKIRWKRGRRKK